MPVAISKTRALYLTLDTDWCTEEILEFAIALFHERRLPCTVFATGPYAALQSGDTAMLEIGLHPNFNPGTPESFGEKLQALRRLYPRAVGVSSHAMVSGTILLDLFKNSGLFYDRNILRYKDAAAEAFVYHNGLLRLPVFWEDDIWFTLEPGARFSAGMLGRENFHLIFNFHPIHLFMNTASAEHYQAFKPHQHDLQKLAPHRRADYGALSFFEGLAAYMQQEGLAAGLLRDFLRP